jgi:nucleoid-associated protein YgaU
MTRSLLATVLAGVAVISFSGCEQVFQNRSERSQDVAEKKAAEGDYRAAVLAYEASLDGTPKTAEIHYKLGLIYDDKLLLPISAMHHFQRYIDLDPKGAHVKDAQAFLKEDKLKMVAELGNGATVPQEEAVRLKNDNLILRKQVVELRAELEASAHARALALKAMGSNSSQKGQEQKPLVPGVRTYVVEPGDTLASISRKFYHSSGKWKDIQDANFNALEGTAKLKPGMTLMIP